MTTAHLQGLMYRYDDSNGLADIIRKGLSEFKNRFGYPATMAAVHPGTVMKDYNVGLEIVERKWIRKNHILIGTNIVE